MRGALVLFALAACGDPRDGGLDPDARDADPDADPAPCTSLIGDRARPIEVVPIGVGPGGAVDLSDGGAVALTVPPQGGIVLLAGGRARNLDGCAATVTASLRDPSSGMVIGLESRPSQLTLGADGWGYPTIELFFALANVAVCPSASTTRDVFGNPWLLEVRITDGRRDGTATVTVVPDCDRSSAPDFCRCICAADMPMECPGPFG